VTADFGRDAGSRRHRKRAALQRPGNIQQGKIGVFERHVARVENSAAYDFRLSALGRADALSRSDDDSQSWFGTIQAQAKNLLGMVNSIMAATRIESRTVEVHNQPTNVIQPD
jgi:signal transduction histidine kinase